MLTNTGVLDSVLIYASLFLELLRPSVSGPSPGMIPFGLTWEDLFPFLILPGAPSAWLLAARRRPAANPNENQRPACALRGLRDSAFCFRRGRLPRQNAAHRPRRSTHLRMVPRRGRRQAAAL